MKNNQDQQLATTARLYFVASLLLVLVFLFVVKAFSLPWALVIALCVILIGVILLKIVE